MKRRIGMSITTQMQIRQWMGMRLVRYGVVSVVLISTLITGIIVYHNVLMTTASYAAVAVEARHAASALRFKGKNNFEAMPPPNLLTYFRGHYTDGQALLRWATSKEKNNQFFAIERSTNGHAFEEITRIPGAGNSQQALTYQYRDLTAPAGLIYYRLKQTNYDGQFETSEVISVTTPARTTKTIEITIDNVSPNPFTDHFTINLTAASETSLSVMITDRNGPLVFHQIYPIATGEQQITVTLPKALENGLYIVTISHQGKTIKQLRVEAS